MWDFLVWCLIWTFFVFIGLMSASLLTCLFFIVCHFLYWEFVGKKNAIKLLEEIDMLTISLIIEVLKKIKTDRSRKL